jgi:polysaccharide transporter, PST family
MNLFQKKYKVLFENFCSLSILNGINVLVPFITIKYLSDTITDAQYGGYYYIYTIIQTLIVVTSYGFNFSATKLISENRDNRDYVNKVFNAVTASKLILSIASILVVLVLSPWLLDTQSLKIMFLLGLGMVIGDVFTPTWLFQGMEKMKYMTIVNSSSKILFTLLVFVVVREPQDYIWLLLLYSCGYILAGILSITLVYKQFNLKIGLTTRKDIIFQFKAGASVFGSTMGINLYRRANVIILKQFVSDDLLGIYSIAEQIVRGIQSLINPAVQVLFPHMSLKFKDKTYEDIISLMKRIALPFIAVLIVACVGTILFAPFIIRIISDIDKYSDSIALVRWLSPVILFGELNYLFGIVGLINMNRQSRFLISVLISGIISVLFIFVFVPIFGVTAAAMAMSIAELLLFFLCLFELLKKR